VRESDPGRVNGKPCASPRLMRTARVPAARSALTIRARVPEGPFAKRGRKLEQAVRLDPNYGPPRGRTSDRRRQLLIFGHHDPGLGRQDLAAGDRRHRGTRLALDPPACQPRGECCPSQSTRARNPEAAVSAAERATELGPWRSGQLGRPLPSHSTIGRSKPKRRLKPSRRRSPWRPATAHRIITAPRSGKALRYFPCKITKMRLPIFARELYGSNNQRWASCQRRSGCRHWSVPTTAVEAEAAWARLWLRPHHLWQGVSDDARTIRLWLISV